MLDGDSLRSSPGLRQRSTGRRSGSLPLAQVVVPAEERLYGDEAWMRQRTPGRERVVVGAEERLFGDEAWLRQRCRGPSRVLVPADERLSGDEAWRRSDGSSLKSPSVAARRSVSRLSQGRGSGGAVAADADRRASVAAAPPPVPAAGSSGLETPTGRGSPPAGPVVALCNGDGQCWQTGSGLLNVVGSKWCNVVTFSTLVPAIALHCSLNNLKSRQ